MLSVMFNQNNYAEIKKAFLKAISKEKQVCSGEFSKISYRIHKLGLKYINHILDIKFELNDNEIIFPEHFIQEWHFELEAYKSCLEDCIKIVESNILLENFIIDLEDRLDDYNSQLYPGFLSSSEDVLEVSLMYNTLKEFKTALEKIINSSD